LPDPIESGLSDKLDDEIDAVQKAAESQGYGARHRHDRESDD
jgi:hypothetical protein